MSGPRRAALCHYEEKHGLSELDLVLRVLQIADLAVRLVTALRKRGTKSNADS